MDLEFSSTSTPYHLTARQVWGSPRGLPTVSPEGVCRRHNRLHDDPAPLENHSLDFIKNTPLLRGALFILLRSSSLILFPLQLLLILSYHRYIFLFRLPIHQLSSHQKLFGYRTALPVIAYRYLLSSED